MGVAREGRVRSVLIADDDGSIRPPGAGAVLRSEAYTVLEAADGDEAWKSPRAHRCAVAMLDVQMPGKTGLEVARLVSR